MVRFMVVVVVMMESGGDGGDGDSNNGTGGEVNCISKIRCRALEKGTVEAGRLEVL